MGIGRAKEVGEIIETRSFMFKEGLSGKFVGFVYEH